MSVENPFILPPFEPPSPLKIPFVVLAVLFGGSVVCGYWMYSERGKANTAARIATQDLKASQARAAALESDKAQLESEKTQLEADKAQLETVKSELDSVKRELAKTVQAKDEEVAALKRISDNVRDKMKDEMSHGEIRLMEAGSKVRLLLADKALFESGDVQVSKHGEGVLTRLAEALAEIPDQEIQVAGHTDRAPVSSKLAAQYPNNWELSAARATSVVRFLTEKGKLPAQQLSASGYGEYQPIASNKSSAGRAKNRRIEILLTPTPAPATKSKIKAAVAAKKAEKTKKSGQKPKVLNAAGKPHKVAKK